MSLIVLPAATLRLPSGGCYLLAVDAPLGGTEPIRDCCSVNSPLTSAGSALPPLQTGLFCVGLELRPPRWWGGALMSLLHAAPPRRAVILGASASGKAAVAVPPQLKVGGSVSLSIWEMCCPGCKLE